MIETIVQDANGKQFKEGSRARLAGYTDEEEGGEVILVSDPDGDLDDEGKPFGIPPCVRIKFDDGTEESFSSTWTAKGWWDEQAPYLVEDLYVA